MDPFGILNPTTASWLRGSLFAPVFPAYVQYLVERQYAVITQRSYCGAVAHFARWFEPHEGGVTDLTPADVRRFVDEHLPHCTCPPPARRSRHECRAALRHLVRAMRADRVLTEDPVSDAVEDELRRFDAEMDHQRGLAENTRTQRLRIVRRLLSTTPVSDPGPMGLVSASRLRRFLAEEHGRWSPSSARVLVSTLRGYLRFRAAGGDQVGHLLPVIVSPAHWRLAALPDALSPAEVARLLASFPPDLPSTARAYAMVRCLVDLGLRTHEVARLQLGDIDWHAGTIRIGPAKSRRVDTLPLPHATGCAIAAYLRSERPATGSRCVFVRHVAPVDMPISPNVVRNAVRAAYRRCGLPYTRVHLLRHTLASRVLAEGGTLKEIADLLRHRALDTSLIYTKVDGAHLLAVAQPWPGDAP